MTEAEFKAELDHLDKMINTVTRLEAVNAKLRQYNWVFLHPYNFAIDITYLGQYADEKSEEKIFNVFARRFLELRTTISFLEGFFKKTPYLKNYGRQIEDSLILCLQRDFGGAISLLLPVIEGTLRSYLISRNGNDAKSIVGTSLLLKSLDHLVDDYLNLQSDYLRERDPVSVPTETQRHSLLEKHRMYVTLWIKQLRDYLENNLYCDTRRPGRSDSFNRHTIFHGFEEDIKHSFRNYLRLFHCIHLLNWALRNITKGASPLIEIDEQLVMDKWVQYFRILILSESLSEAKAKISGQDSENFRPYLKDIYKELIDRPAFAISEILKAFDPSAPTAKHHSFWTAFFRYMAALRF